MTRHQYALAQGFVEIVADDDAMFWAIDVETERGIVIERAGQWYVSQCRDERNKLCGPIGNGASMDAALAAMLARR